MSFNSVLVRILQSVLGVLFGGSVTDSVVVIATTLLVTIFGVLVLMWGSQEALMVKDEEDEFEVAVASVVFFGQNFIFLYCRVILWVEINHPTNKCCWITLISLIGVCHFQKKKKRSLPY